MFYAFCIKIVATVVKYFVNGADESSQREYPCIHVMTVPFECAFEWSMAVCHMATVKTHFMLLPSLPELSLTRLIFGFNLQDDLITKLYDMPSVALSGWFDHFPGLG